MKGLDFSEEQALRRLRRLVLIPVGWLIVVIVFPNLFLDLFDLRVAWVSSVAKAIGILLYAGLFAYLLAQVRKEAKLVVIVLIGLGLLSVSELIELGQAFNLLPSPMTEEVSKTARIIENAATGVGIGIIGTVIIYAIVDMLVVRHRLLNEHDRLTQEIGVRQQVEASLRESEAKYRELVQNANSIILRMDRDGKVTFINEFAQRFLGYSESEILGKNVIGTIVPQVDSEGRDLTAMIRGIMDEPAAYTSNENENMRRDGERVWIAWTNKPIVFDGDGRAREILCVGNDITSRVRAEKLLAIQRTKMIESARLASLGVMAGSIAHEINNPLAIIAGCAEQLETHSAVGADAGLNTKLAPMIRRNIDRIERIIQGLRSLSRDASSDPFVETRVSSIVGNTIELCQERFRLHDVYIEFGDFDAEATVECRAAQIGQVVLNLLNNSFDAIKELPEKWIKLSVVAQGGGVELAVVDSGSGIPGEIAKRLFLPFFTTKSEEHGLGLGLSISHAIIEAHHGEILADASSEHTRFLVRLPKHQPAPVKAG